MGRSVDNVSVCVGLEERRGSPRSWVPLLLMLEDLDRESLECFCVQNFCKLEGGGFRKATLQPQIHQKYQMSDDLGPSFYSLTSSPDCLIRCSARGFFARHRRVQHSLGGRGGDG